MNIMIITRQPKKRISEVKMDWTTFFIIVGAATVSYYVCKFLFWLDK